MSHTMEIADRIITLYEHDTLNLWRTQLADAKEAMMLEEWYAAAEREREQ